MTIVRKYGKKILLLIPESRKKPFTNSLLYKQIVRFFEEEKIADKFEIKCIEIPKSNVPPTHFRSGALWVKKEHINQMATSIVEYLHANSHERITKPVAYVRGAYLEAVRLANKKLQATGHNLQPIQEIFTDDELARLKKKGIMWMKVGLRMPEAFEIFKREIKKIIHEDQSRQLTLF